LQLCAGGRFKHHNFHHHFGVGARTVRFF
jgi:hypothetical protein